MKTSSLESKTIRPGFNNYAFYSSDRHLQSRAIKPVAVKKSGNSKSHAKRNLMFFVILALIGFGGYTALSKNTSHKSASTPVISSQPGSTNQATANTPVAAVKKCAGNQLSQLVVISITDRHMWACEAGKQIKDYPIITGMQKIEENATPPGTYKIYAKQRDTVLSGTASTGSWEDPVAYWMPFLDNQFGTYGFHDASWRQDSEYGHVDPNSEKGSHGCVEMTAAASEWLYNWAKVGTTVSIYL